MNMSANVMTRNVLSALANLDLPFKCDTETLGDGNCFLGQLLPNISDLAWLTHLFSEVVVIMEHCAKQLSIICMEQETFCWLLARQINSSSVTHPSKILTPNEESMKH